ncbi:MAG: 50S ribosomal protein L35 [Candidatus Pacebacteria bacterium]|nr:50S ribosomal protein L35 [Candidatus Paceibacterota bacterium]MBP9058162.1 50S ribosomal protein L35 [Candidatus Paceibacterota bacterium]MBP9769920.1 50S ribosomal protein L35 [Candidatus Paceibacterota bacterium]
MTMKTNKSFTKRLKITKNGKLIGRKPGFSHFNAKQDRRKQLAGNRGVEFVLPNKERSRVLPGR